MTAEPMLVQVPQALYERLAERARQGRRSVEEEIVEALAEHVSLDEALPADLAGTLDALAGMPDDALWELAHSSHLSPTAAAYLEELNQKRQREGNSADEEQAAEALLHQYERAVLVRAEAMAHLKERGRDITPLLAPISR